MTVVHPSITPGSSGTKNYPLINEMLAGSGLAPFLGGAIVQVNAVIGGSERIADLTQQPVTVLLEQLPHLVETRRREQPRPNEHRYGFRGVANNQIGNFTDVYAAYLDHEAVRPGGQGTSVDPMRFDAGRRGYSNNELEYAARCMVQLKAAGRELGHEPVLAGIWNCPNGDGSNADRDAVVELHRAAGTGFLFAPGYETGPSVHADLARLDRTIEHRLALAGEIDLFDLREVILTVMPRNPSISDHNGTFELHWNTAETMYNRAYAMRRHGVSCMFWMNAAWFDDEANHEPIRACMNALAEGLAS